MLFVLVRGKLKGMGEAQQASSEVVSLSRDRLLPSVQVIGGKSIEFTFLGVNAAGLPTWILWNPQEPYLLGMLCQGKSGFNFEQRTTQGVLVHENISLERVQRALTA